MWQGGEGDDGAGRSSYVERVLKLGLGRGGRWKWGLNKNGCLQGLKG